MHLIQFVCWHNFLHKTNFEKYKPVLVNWSQTPLAQQMNFTWYWKNKVISNYMADSLFSHIKCSQKVEIVNRCCSMVKYNKCWSIRYFFYAIHFITCKQKKKYYQINFCNAMDIKRIFKNIFKLQASCRYLTQKEMKDHNGKRLVEYEWV